MTEKLVVFIQIHGEAEKLEKCLLSLANQTRKPDLVVVVDDGTPDTSVYLKYCQVMKTLEPEIKVDYCQAALPKDPNLDTVGKAIRYAWLVKVSGDNRLSFDYLSIIDVDSQPEELYYSLIVNTMELDSDLVCASGVICVGDKTEELISAKVIKRKDARGSGKVIRTDFLAAIPPQYFPEVAWDTWINIRAKLAGKKAEQIPYATLYTDRATTRLSNRNNFRDGRLTYHFGYNPLILLYKVIFRGKDVLRGYLDARKNNWKLPDPEVRKWFGIRFLFHFWK